MSNSFSILVLTTFRKALPRYWQDWPLIAFDFYNLTVSIKSNGKRAPLLRWAQLKVLKLSHIELICVICQFFNCGQPGSYIFTSLEREQPPKLWKRELSHRKMMILLPKEGEIDTGQVEITDIHYNNKEIFSVPFISTDASVYLLVQLKLIQMQACASQSNKNNNN